MSDEAVGSPIDRAVCLFKAGCQVIGIQDGYFGGAGQTLGTHHADVGIGDRQDAGTSVGCGSHFVLFVVERSMSR